MAESIEYDIEEVRDILQLCSESPERFSEWQQKFCTDMVEKFKRYRKPMLSQKQLDTIYKLEELHKNNSKIAEEEHLNIIDEANQKMIALSPKDQDFIKMLNDKDLTTYRLSSGARRWLYSIRDKLAKAA